MRSNKIYKDKSKEELISELELLQHKYNSLEELYKFNIAESLAQGKALSKLNKYTLELSNLSPKVSLEEVISKMIKDITGAKAVLFSDYDRVERSLTVQHVEMESEFASKVVGLLGRQIKKSTAFLTDDNYNVISSEIIGIRKTLYEASFGSVPPMISSAIQKLLSIDHFIGFAYVIEGKLYGTSLLAMGKNQPDPSRQILENIVYLAAVSLRRKKTEIALKESQTQFTALLQAIPDMMFVQDKNGVYLAYHAPDDSKLYASPENFIGKSITEVLPADVAGKFMKVVEEAICTKKIQNLEYSLSLPEGDFHFESRTVCYEDKVLSIIRDITERKTSDLRIQEQNFELQKLNHDKDRFMSILAHDLKNPFNSILGFLDLLLIKLDKYDKAKIREHLTTIKSSASHFYQLLESLLLWIRSQSGKMNFTPQNVYLFEIIEHVKEELKLNIEVKKLNVSIHVQEDQTVYADMEMLKTILRNLISNAVKFTQKGGDITISLEMEKEKVIVVVADNGIGLEPGDEKRIFEMPGKSETLGTEGEHGTGLGLFLCKELVEIHSGEIWAESEPGNGSKFKFTLPYKIE